MVIIKYFTILRDHIIYENIWHLIKKLNLDKLIRLCKLYIMTMFNKYINISKSSRLNAISMVSGYQVVSNLEEEFTPHMS